MTTQEIKSKFSRVKSLGGINKKYRELAVNMQHDCNIEMKNNEEIKSIDTQIKKIHKNIMKDFVKKLLKNDDRFEVCETNLMKPKYEKFGSKEEFSKCWNKINAQLLEQSNQDEKIIELKAQKNELENVIVKKHNQKSKHLFEIYKQLFNEMKEQS